MAAQDLGLFLHSQGVHDHETVALPVVVTAIRFGEPRWIACASFGGFDVVLQIGESDFDVLALACHTETAIHLIDSARRRATELLTVLPQPVRLLISGMLQPMQRIAENGIGRPICVEKMEGTLDSKAAFPELIAYLAEKLLSCTDRNDVDPFTEHRWLWGRMKTIGQHLGWANSQVMRDTYWKADEILRKRGIFATDFLLGAWNSISAWHGPELLEEPASAAPGDDDAWDDDAWDDTNVGELEPDTAAEMPPRVAPHDEEPSQDGWVPTPQFVENALRKAFGVVGFRPFRLGEKAEGAPPHGQTSSEVVAMLRAAAEIYTATRIRRSLDHVCDVHGCKPMPVTVLGGRPMDIGFWAGDVLLGAYCRQRGCLYLVEDGRPTYVVEMRDSIPYRGTAATRVKDQNLCVACGGLAKSGHKTCGCVVRNTRAVHERRGRKERNPLLEYQQDRDDI